ncbi:DNA-binding protein [Pseudodesulfovibrio sp. JC047]|uniref:DVU_1557 family redox protein n=1 Tax=Pseudodesulfovibrio sp. JC047 TaxID=2683199 RepID=UPI0013D7756C|nr:CLJU_RS11820 family redox protein [Pseudodesulfovibrio sp. JC047]NDV19870.1 DNA-binding protein [Pseudodesulfovibrio sp. JC047]
MSVIKVPEADIAGWTCATCGTELVLAPVELEYLDSLFNVELPRCPSCGFVYIPEGLALGKMHQVEQLLEDK